MELPTVDVEAKISKTSLIQLVLGLSIVVTLTFMLSSIVRSN